MPLITSVPRCISSVLMNEGAKVLEVGVPVFELGRFCVVALLLGDITPASEENDWLRL